MMKSVKSYVKGTAIAVLCLTLLACGGEMEQAGPKISTVQNAPNNSAGQMDQENNDQQSADHINDNSADLEKAGNTKIHVGILLPLSGPNAPIGNSMLNAVTMALFDSYDPRIVLYPLDTKGTIEGTNTATQKAIDYKARIVIGPLLSGNVTAAGTLLASHNIPLIGLSNDRTVATRGRYILGFLPESEIDRIVSYTLQQGKGRMSALIPEGAYGDRVLTRFGQSLTRLGGDVMNVETYPNDPDNVQDPVKRVSNYDNRYREFRAEVNYLKSLQLDLSDSIAKKLQREEKIPEPKFDAILIPEGGDLLRTLVPLLPFYEVDPKKIQFMGTGLMNDPDLMNDPPLQGTWFAGVPPKKLTAFSQRYLSNFGETPPRLASVAYDAMGLVTMVLRRTMAQRLKNQAGLETLPEKEDPIFTYEALEYANGFMGINGLFRFLPDGTNERSLAILEIRSKGLKVVDKAPSQFPAFGFMLQQVAEIPKLTQENPKEE